MKVGLFFGSFNPIHIGHLIIANYMLEFTEVEEVWFVVSPQNPFKIHDQLEDSQHRLKMVQLALDDNPKFKALDIEFGLPKPSFTINTLHYLKEKSPNHDFILIMGSDNLAQLPKWKGFDEIINNYNLFVYHREGSDNQELKARDNVRVFDAPVLSISATFIRDVLHAGKSIKYLVPGKVEDYIHSNKLY